MRCLLSRKEAQADLLRSEGQNGAELLLDVERVESSVHSTASAPVLNGQLLHYQRYKVVRQPVDRLHRSAFYRSLAQCTEAIHSRVASHRMAPEGQSG